jgi:nucleoside-diphosphate-sugar epimerase
MSRILVTGATGFVGRHVVPELVARGHEVHAVGRTPVQADANVLFRQCDLLNPDAVESVVESIRAESLIHLAWTSAPHVFWFAPDNVDWVAATVRLFRAFVEHGGRRAILAGTCAEYDWSFDLLTEDETPLLPRSLYGRAKLDAANLVFDAASERGTSVAWARIFFVYGPGEPHGRLVPDVISGLLEGRSVECTGGHQQRDYIHVKDVASALIDVLASNFHGNINVASGQCRPVAALIEEIARQLQRPDLIRLGAVPLPPGEPPRLAANTSRLLEQIGFRPKFDLERGVADTISACRALSSH